MSCVCVCRLYLGATLPVVCGVRSPVLCYAWPHEQQGCAVGVASLCVCCAARAFANWAHTCDWFQMWDGAIGPPVSQQSVLVQQRMLNRLHMPALSFAAPHQGKAFVLVDEQLRLQRPRGSGSCHLVRTSPAAATFWVVRVLPFEFEPPTNKRELGASCNNSRTSKVNCNQQQHMYMCW